MRSPRARLGCAAPMTPRFACSMGMDIPGGALGWIPPSAPRRRSLQWRLVGNEALLQRRTIHIPDVQAEAERFPDSSYMGRGIRTLLVTPLLREGTAIGLINIRRTELKPFTDKQVALLETFAAQAVIAIENVRLFKEIRSATRNCARRWSIRRQRRRCSASSAARRRTCSRCSTPSSRAQRGFAGSMTWCCGSRGGRYGFAGSFWSHSVPGASRSVLMSPDPLDTRAGTLHVPDVRAERCSNRDSAAVRARS